MCALHVLLMLDAVDAAIIMNHGAGIKYLWYLLG